MPFVPMTAICLHQAVLCTVMTAVEGIQRRAGTGVFIPPGVLQQTAFAGESSVHQLQPCSADVEKHSSLRRPGERPASSRHSISSGAQHGPDNSQRRGCSSPAEDTAGCRAYQQSSCKSDTMPKGPTAARAAAAASGRSSGRFSVDSTVTTHRTVRRGSGDSVSSGPSGPHPISNCRPAPAAVCSPFQSALYSSSVPASTAIMSAPRAPASQGGRAGPATRRMSVDLHNLKGAGPTVGGLASPQMGSGGVMLSPQGYRAAPCQPNLGRRSFDVGSGFVGCYSANQTAPLPTVAVASAGMVSSMITATRAHSCSSATRLCDPMQLQQSDSWLGNPDVSQLLSSPALTAEQSLDDQIQTVLMDILDLGNQLAAAADAAGVTAVANSSSRHSMDVQPQMGGFNLMDRPVLPAEVAALAVQQQVANSVPVRGLPCSLAPSSADPTMSPRTSFDLLLLQQQQQQMLSASAPADAASLAPFGGHLSRTTPLTSSFTGMSMNLDSIDEAPEDLAAYFARHQQQKVNHHQFLSSAAAVASGTTTPMLSTSPQTSMMANIYPSAGLGDQMLTNPNLGALPATLRPEAQAKLQELMAAQQLQLEIQNELLAMLTA